MNWLDLALIITVIGGAVFGLWIGFLGAAFATLGIGLGMLFAGQVTDNVLVRFDEYISNETLMSILGYAVSILLFSILALVSATSIKKFLRLASLGWIDRLVGMALVSAAGVVISIVAVVVMAGMAYGDETSSEIRGDSYLDKVLVISGAREMMVDSLKQSAVAPRLISLLDSSTVSDITFLPLGFRVAAHNLLANYNQRSDSDQFAHNCRDMDVENRRIIACHLGADSLGEF